MTRNGKKSRVSAGWVQCTWYMGLRRQCNSQERLPDVPLRHSCANVVCPSLLTSHDAQSLSGISILAQPGGDGLQTYASFARTLSPCTPWIPYPWTLCDTVQQDTISSQLHEKQMSALGRA